MPFIIFHRALEEKRARLGLVECVNHDLLQPYPVLHEKPGMIYYLWQLSVKLLANFFQFLFIFLLNSAVKLNIEVV